MADENFLIRIQTTLIDGISRNSEKIRDRIGELEDKTRDWTSSLNENNTIQKKFSKGIQDLETKVKSIGNSFNKQNEVLKEYDRRLESLSNHNQGLTKLLEKQKKQLEENQEALEKENKILEKINESKKEGIITEEELIKASKDRDKAQKEVLKTQKAIQRTEKDLIENSVIATNVIEERNRAIRDSMSITDRARASYRRFNTIVEQNKRAAENNATAWGKLRKSFGETQRDSKQLERRLALLGRAMLGLVIASIVIFFHSLISSLVAVIGQVIALAGSLTYAAGVLVGTFIPAVAQAIPVVGALAAVMQRLTLISEALTAQEALKQAGQREGVQDDQQAIENAQQIADAQRGVVESQRDLTEARADARRELQDLILAERQAELAMRGAIISQVEARENLQDVIQSGDIGGLPTARLGVSESNLGVRSARIDLSRARQDANQARAGGVEGMDRVTDASNQLADAQRNLARAHQSAAQGASELTAQESNLEYILSQLTPAEKELFKQLVQLKERFEQTFTPITDIIIRSISRGLDRAENLLFDNRIVAGFERLAQGMANAFDRVTKVLTNDKSISFWTDVLGEGRRNLKPLTDIAINLWRVFRNLTEAAAPVFRELLEDIVKLTQDWVDNTKKKNNVTEFFETGLKHLRAWGRLLLGILDLWSALMGVSGDSAIRTLDDFTKRLHDGADGLRENRRESREFFNQTSKALGYIIDILVVLGEELAKAFDARAVRALRDILAEIILPALGEAVRILGQLIIKIDELVSGTVIGELLKIAITFKLVAGGVGLLVALIRPLIGYVGSLIDKFVLLSKLFGFGGTAGGFLRFAGWIGLAIGAIILFRDEIIELGEIIWERVRKPIQDLINAFKELVDTWSGTAKEAGGLKGVFQSISRFLGGTFFEILKKVADGFGQQLAGAIKVITGLLKILSGDFSGFGDIFEGLLDGIIGSLKVFTAPFREVGKTLGNAFKDAFVGAFELAKTVVGGIADKILGLFSTILGTLGDVLEELPSVSTPFGDVDFGEPGDKLVAASEEIDNFRESLRGEEEATERADKATKKYSRTKEELASTTGNVTKETEREKDETKKGSKEKDKGSESTKKYRRQLGNLIDTLFGTGEQSSELGRVIRDVTNDVLSAFGADKLNFKVAKPKKPNMVSGIGTSGLQRGGWIGSPWERGPDDRLIGVAGGEAVLTGHQQKAVDMALAYGNMAGVIPFRNLDDLFLKDRREHRTSGYAKGGKVPQGGFPDAMGALPGLDALAYYLKKQFGLGVVSGIRPGSITTSGNISDHSWGGAIDVSNGVTTPQMDAAHAWLRRTLGGGGDFSTNYSGGAIKQMLYKTMIGGNHFDHIHIALNEQYARSAAAVIQALGGQLAKGMMEEIPRILIKGPDGPLKDMLQSQSDELRKAAQKKVDKTAARGYGKFDEVSGTLSASQVRRIFLQAFKIAGVSPRGGNLSDLMNLAYEESTWNPMAENRTAAGLAAGLPQGILQVIGSTFNAYKLPGYNNIFNPLHNAIASIRYQMDRYGDIRRHAPYGKGGKVPQFDQGGVVPGSGPQVVVAHGGETILPTHKFQTGGRADLRNLLQKIRRSTNRLGRGNFSDSIRELLREGGLFDDLAAAIDFFVAAQARRIAEFTYRVRRGMVVQIRTHEKIARRQLRVLEETGRTLNRELDEIESLMRGTRRRLQNTKDAGRKKELRAALNNLEQRAAEVGDAVAQNLADRYEAQAAILEAFISRIQQRIGLQDLQQQIIELQGELSGNIDADALRQTFIQRGSLLERERERIQQELRRVRRRGDRERELELEQALLENKVAILENTQSLKELDGTLGQTFDFNSTAWQLWRVAILNGMGGLMPGIPNPPAVSSPNIPIPQQTQAINAQNNDTIVQITEPMEVADPVALSNAIAFKLKMEVNH